MAFGRSRIAWYDILLIGLAAAIVYPDKCLDWIGERTGRAFGLRHVVFLQVVAFGLLIIAMILLMPVYPKLHWWHPLVFVGMLGLFRVIARFITALFGFEDR